MFWKNGSSGGKLTKILSLVPTHACGKLCLLFRPTLSEKNIPNAVGSLSSAIEPEIILVSTLVLQKAALSVKLSFLDVTLIRRWFSGGEMVPQDGQLG